MHSLDSLFVRPTSIVNAFFYNGQVFEEEIKFFILMSYFPYTNITLMPPISSLYFLSNCRRLMERGRLNFIFICAFNIFITPDTGNLQESM